MTTAIKYGAKALWYLFLILLVFNIAKQIFLTY